MAWQNPLRNLPLIPAHPSITSELSSAVSDWNAFEGSSLAVNNLLDEFGRRDKKYNRAASILGAFLERLPKGGKAMLNAEIEFFSEDEEKLLKLAQHLVEAILKPFKVAGGKAPTTEITPSLASGAAEDIAVAMTLIEPSTRDDQAWLKKACLRRDNFRCVWSGFLDKNSMRKKLVQPLPGHAAIALRTECAHIIPFALGKFDEKNSIECQNLATIWYAIHRYFPSLKGKIHAGNVSQPANAITLNAATHQSFRGYDFAFWPQSEDHWYELRSFDGVFHAIPSKSGTALMHLESNDPSIPLPDKEYFKVHHRIGQILEVSGIGREIEMEMEEAECDVKNMDPGGSTDIGLLVSRRMVTNVGI